MDMQRQKQKQVPKNLKQKINLLLKSLNSERGQWIDNYSFILTNCQQVNQRLNEIFDMSYKTFLKFTEMVGCKIKKQTNSKQENDEGQIYLVTLPVQDNSSRQQNFIKELMQNVNVDSIHFNNSATNNFECSIEANIQKPQHQLFNLENQNDFKDFFIANFKTNVDSTNEFISNAFYRILSSRDSKKMSPCQIMQLLTELRDRLFENQRQLEDCMSNFQQKIKSFGNQAPHLQNQNGKQMSSQMEIEDHKSSKN